jgi:hypothetical protein
MGGAMLTALLIIGALQIPLAIIGRRLVRD